MAFGKRKRVMAPRATAAAKRRRTFKKRRMARRQKKNFTMTSRNTAPTDLKRRGKRMSSRTWRNLLWKDTILDEKYKATFSFASTVTSPADQLNQTAVIIEMFDNTNPPWTTGGGLIRSGPGAAVSLTPKSVVFRGGQLDIDLGNSLTTVEALELRVQLVYPKQEATRYNSVVRTNVPLIDYVTALPGTTPKGTSYQDLNDWSQFFHPPVMDKSIILQSGEFARFSHKLKIKKVDADHFAAGGGMFPRWIVYASNIGASGANGVSITTQYSVTFTLNNL